MFAEFRLRGGAERAFLNEIGILFTLFSRASVFFNFADVVKPLLGCVVHPGIDMRERGTLDMERWLLLWGVLVNKVVLLFLA